jgi:hypothetical protein
VPFAKSLYFLLGKLYMYLFCHDHISIFQKKDDGDKVKKSSQYNPFNILKKCGKGNSKFLLGKYGGKLRNPACKAGS